MCLNKSNTRRYHCVFIYQENGANELAANGNSENNPRFTPSGNPLGNFLMSKYYFVIDQNNIYNG
jgi:hypothetical protein